MDNGNEVKRGRRGFKVQITTVGGAWGTGTRGLLKAEGWKLERLTGKPSNGGTRKEWEINLATGKKKGKQT